MPDIGTISKSAIGENILVEWKISNFFSLSVKNCASCHSSLFSFGGERWWLEIYPNVIDDYFNLELKKYFSDRSTRLAFSLSLKSVKGEKVKEKHCTKLFKEVDSHVFTEFITKLELKDRRSELVPGGVLTIVCTMKNTTTTGSASYTASARASVECCYCKGFFKADILSSHQKKCMHRTIKCPDCLEIVVLQKWLDEHECQQERPEARKRHKEYSESVCADATTQTAKQDDAIFLCEDYKKVLLGGRHHDLILKVGDKELKAHRDILRARSRVFESMLDHDMKEKSSGIIDVSDCDQNAMELFLSYVYCGKIEALDPNNMLGLYYVADKYEMMELKRECCNFIKKSLSLTNICNVIQLALKHSDSDLLEYASGYFQDNVLEIMQTVEWQSFLKENSTVGNELLMKSIKKLKNALT